MIRDLKTSDIFKMSKILKKMGLKKEIDVNDEKTKKEKTQKQVGAELVVSIFENLHLAETEVNEFLAELTGYSAEEFSELSIVKTIEIIKEFKSISGLASFLDTASQ